MNKLSDCVSVIYFQSNQRLSSSQSSQPLSTPVVSITTPSQPHHSLVYSGISSAYNNGTWCLFVLYCCHKRNPGGPNDVTIWQKKRQWNVAVFLSYFTLLCICWFQVVMLNCLSILLFVCYPVTCHLCLCQSTPWTVQSCQASAPLQAPLWAPWRHGSYTSWAHWGKYLKRLIFLS